MQCVCVYVGSSDGPSSAGSSVKESLRHKLKANRRIKQEPQMDTDAPGGEIVACCSPPMGRGGGGEVFATNRLYCDGH